MVKRNVKFQYFTLIRLKKSGNGWQNLGRLDIEEWIDKVKCKSLLNKALGLGVAAASVDRIFWDEENKVWILRFMKLREDNVPSIVRDHQEAKAISLDQNEFIGEGLHVLYDNDLGIAMVQVNRFSLSIKRLEEFLTDIWGTPTERLVLRAIIDQFEFEGKPGRSYRSLEIKFANIVKDSSPRALGTIIDSFKNYNGLAGSIKINLGRKRRDTLNIERVNETIQDALKDSAVVGLKLHVKEDDQRSTEIIDLYDNVCADIITFMVQPKTVLEFEYAAGRMAESYRMKKEHIARLVGAKK